MFPLYVLHPSGLLRPTLMYLAYSPATPGTSDVIVLVVVISIISVLLDQTLYLPSGCTTRLSTVISPSGIVPVLLFWVPLRRTLICPEPLFRLSTARS